MARDRRLRIGIVGMGFMGLTHFRAAAKLHGAALGAIVTSDPKKARGDFRGLRGNFGAGGQKVQLKGIDVHPSLESLLDDDSIDLVDICLPSYLHVKAATAALTAGKNVIVEKPIALKSSEATRILSQAKKSPGLLMVGQVLKFFPEFALLTDAIRTEKWGKLLALHLRRIIAKPEWGADSWFADPAKSGGMVVDLHIHDTDLIVYLFGKPRSVTSSGLIRNRTTDYVRTVYHYNKKMGPLLSSEAGWINAPGLGFEHGYDAFFEDGTLHFNSTHASKPVLVRKSKGRPLKLRPADGFQEELQAAVDAVRAGKVPLSLSAATAATSLAVCHAEEKSARTHATVSL